MPLMSSSFTPGQAQATVNSFQDKGQRQIAQAELYYFSARAEECKDIAELYLQDKDIYLRLSAGLLYSFSNLTLGNPSAAKMGFRNIQECLHQTEQNPPSNEAMASCVFANYLAMVLMHLPTDKLPPLQEVLDYLPAGLRAYGIYVLAHNAYLHEEYANALGMCQSALSHARWLLSYCHGISLLCNHHEPGQPEERETKPRDVLMTAWNMAKADGFLEPFIEHHGLMLGQIEACIKPTEPELYKQLSQAVIAFSRGWMNIHNPKLQASVTDKLTPMEFAIAMLASKGWSNQEIANHLSMSSNTIKHYISSILQTLGVKSRKELKPFVNK